MEIIRFNVWDLRPDRCEAVREWVRSLGVGDLDDFAATAAIVPGEQGWELHLSRYVRNEQGAMRLDVARDDVVTEPVIVPLGAERSWPDLGPEAGGRRVKVNLTRPDPELGRKIAESVRKFREMGR